MCCAAGEGVLQRYPGFTSNWENAFLCVSCQQVCGGRGGSGMCQPQVTGWLEVSLALFTFLFHFNFPFVALFLLCNFFLFVFISLEFWFFVLHCPALPLPPSPPLPCFPDQAAAVGHSRPGAVPQPHSQLHPRLRCGCHCV